MESNPENQTSQNQQNDGQKKKQKKKRIRTPKPEYHIKSKSKKRTLFLFHNMDTHAFYLNRDYFDGSKFFEDEFTDVILLEAPMQYVNFRSTFTSTWFNMDSVGYHESLYDYSDVIYNQKRVVKIIQRVVKDYNGDYSKIFLGGFGQGAAFALDLYLKHKPLLGACFCISGFMLPQSKVDPECEYKIMIVHCVYNQLYTQDVSMYSYKPLKTDKADINIVLMETQVLEVDEPGLQALKNYFQKVVKEQEEKEKD